MAREAFENYQNRLFDWIFAPATAAWSLLTLVLMLCCLIGFGGCGQSYTPAPSPATGQVNSYFGSPYQQGRFGASHAEFDHSAQQIHVSSLITTTNGTVPSNRMSANYSVAPTGFLGVTEYFAEDSSGIPVAQNPALTGAWAVEIPGAGALANFLSVTGLGVGAAPVALVDNSSCPTSPTAVSHLYVTVPTPSQTTNTAADYGAVGIAAQGSAITFSVQPFLIGQPMLPFYQVTGGCSQTIFGALTAYPLNSYGTASNLELISYGSAGLLTSSYNPGNAGSSPGAFSGGTGVLGVIQPPTQVSLSSVLSNQYNGFFYSPQNTVSGNYDITVLASSYGDFTATSPACSALQASLVANNGQGAGTVPVLPSPNALYGGEFLSSTSTGSANDPTGAVGSENCDVAIDFGQQDSTIQGLFPNATVFVGSNFPPYSGANPWICQSTGTLCAVSFPAAAVVGTVSGKTVIFVVASASSTPPAQLPNSFGGLFPQPIGIYLFQR